MYSRGEPRMLNTTGQRAEGRGQRAEGRGRSARRRPSALIPLPSPLILLPIALLLSACDLSVGNLTGRATEEWSRSYQLSPGGEVRIGNTNGRVEIEGGEGTTVEIRAEKIARGVT